MREIPMREELGLGESSVIFMISAEGIRIRRATRGSWAVETGLTVQRAGSLHAACDACLGRGRICRLVEGWGRTAR